MNSWPVFADHCWEIPASPVTHRIADRPPPGKSSSKKVAAKSFILQVAGPDTFPGPCLGGAQSIASRELGQNHSLAVSALSRIHCSDLVTSELRNIVLVVIVLMLSLITPKLSKIEQTPKSTCLKKVA